MDGLFKDDADSVLGSFAGAPRPKFANMPPHDVNFAKGLGEFSDLACRTLFHLMVNDSKIHPIQ